MAPGEDGVDATTGEQAMEEAQAQGRELIKEHHYNLRKRLRDGRSVAEVWQANLADHAALEGYAKAMKGLGDEWNGKRDGAPERVDWIVKTVLEYYTTQEDVDRGAAKRAKKAPEARRVTGLVRHLAKDRKREYFQQHREHMPDEQLAGIERELSQQHDKAAGQLINVLDVGSCYNPLAEHEHAGACDILPIDLCPAPDSDVYACDFSSVGFETLEKKAVVVPSPHAPLGSIPKLRLSGFDAVAFCLLLSYMPCPAMRYKCLQNAFCALRPHGLLVIITPRTVGKKDLAWLAAWNRTLDAMHFQRIAQDIKAKIVCLAYKKRSLDSFPPDLPPELATVPIGADDATNPKLFSKR